jgi:hypothetical protein
MTIAASDLRSDEDRMTSAMAPSGRRPLALMSAFRGKQTCRLELRMSANDPKWSSQVTALPFGPDAYCMLLSRRDFLPWLAVAGGVRHESP